MKNVKINNFMESEIIEVDQAIESFRDSGFDLSTACGEIIDNSYEANARTIRIKTYGEKDIDVMAFVDDGIGISKELMSQVLKLGFSTRYNNRKGLGRFGVGLKLASISMARRVDIYSKQSGDKKIYHSYLDLDLIRNKVQNTIKTDVLEDFPQELQELCKDKNNRKLESGTLLVWSKIDRLKEGGSFGNSNKQKISELRDFIARSYRKFIDQGLTIELNDKNVELFDPTFQLDSARTNKILETDEKGIVIEEGEISIDNKLVEYRVTVAPEVIRKYRGDGGIKGKALKYKELRIDRNERKVSILRNGREIYYDMVPRLLPGADNKNNPDRFIGIEILFNAELDEYFQVRNVKRGAQPVDKLFKALGDALNRPIKEARKIIKSTWMKNDDIERKTLDEHQQSINAAVRAEETAPKGRGGLGTSEEEVEDVLDSILEEQGISKSQNREEYTKKKEELRSLPISISDASWYGKELLEIHHLNGKAHVVLNKRHPFFKEVYKPLKDLSNKSSDEINSEDLIYYSRLVTSAIDVLIMAYAKAENMTEDPDAMYSDLRSYWGLNTAAYIRELLRESR
ncbi:ATP-binding protein [Clostridium cadaveris]|uniref:ATP-binding protein n=1 Tax=Clostridium cadaveris TaxID=1529 RepID=UPI000C07A0E8|nr:ATP-binding protein [Clostridium cadaveris]